MLDEGSLKQIADLLDSKLDAKLQPLKTDMDDIKHQMHDVKNQIVNLSQHQGASSELLLRKEAGKMFGEDFKKQFLGNSVFELFELVANKNFDKETSEKIRKLAKEKIHQKFCFAELNNQSAGLFQV